MVPQMKEFFVWAAAAYLAIGVMMAFALGRVPSYENNSVWTFVLLWPLYMLVGMIS